MSFVEHYSFQYLIKNSKNVYYQIIEKGGKRKIVNDCLNWSDTV